MTARSKIGAWSAALGALAWIVLAAGLAYAQFIVPPTPPSILFVPSDKGVTRILVELASLAIGCLGSLLVIAAFFSAARPRALAAAALANVSVCLLCLALLA